MPRQLPAAPRAFAGRAREVSDLDNIHPGSTAVITAIDGMAGVGKTALAVHWAYQVVDRFPDRQLYVNLRGFDPCRAPVKPAAAVRDFLDALQVPPQSIPASAEAQIVLYRSLLAGRRMLVLLDNACDADQVRPLLPGTAGCLVVVSSTGWPRRDHSVGSRFPRAGAGVAGAGARFALVAPARHAARTKTCQAIRMRVLRTPQERFANLPGFSYQPHYATVADGLRMAYVEAGPASGEPVLLLHGEPTWSFLYRRVIPVLADAGLRVIAPDLIGFGRSDKPAEVGDHSYAAHVEWTRSFAFDALDLDGLTVVGHDWGGLIGLRLATECTDRVARMVATNTGLPTGDQQMPDVWLRFREVVRSASMLDVSRLIRSGCRVTPPPEVLAAYDAPFPDETYKAAPRAMPELMPTTPEDPASGPNRAAWRQLAAWDKPFLVAFSDSDPITSAMAPVMRGVVPGARSVTIAGAGHFVQEDNSEELATAIVRFVADRA